MNDYGFIHRYPYTNFHELNLNYILSEVERIAKENGVINRDLEDLKERTNTLEEFFNAIMSGNFPDPFKQALTEWFEVNAVDLMGGLVKFVFFGLTDEGYFTAFIPDSWDDITFGTTGYDDFPTEPVDYGHLTLTY